MDEPSGNWETFETESRYFSNPLRWNLRSAYRFAKYGHRGQSREDGDRYFEHCRAVWRILWVDCQIREYSPLCASWLHDLPEDSGLFSNPLNVSQEEWLLETRYRIALNFGEEVADIVLGMTKRPWETRKDYYIQLSKQGPTTLLVKVADRLHNLRTLGACSKNKRERKAAETVQKYFGLFTIVRTKYPEACDYMEQEVIKSVHELGFAITDLMKVGL